MTPDSVRTGDYERRPEGPPPGEVPVPARIGRFIVTGVLGAGAFGRVYRATDPRLGRDVAIKVPLAAAIDRERFLREARAAAGLHHPNVCPVHEVGEDGGRPFIVMGFVPGQTLAGVLKARTEPLAPKQAAIIARKLALALDAAHRKGIVHRDLKPANVMFDRERRDVVVTDFGLARAPRAGDAEATRDGVLMGTPAYMSPEQARGDTRAVGPASDQFALGVMLYEMLTGRRPFTGTVPEVLGKILHVDPEPPTKLRPDLDPALAAVCLKALAKDPAGRYGSMRQLAEALAPFAGDGPVARRIAPAATRPTDTRALAELFGSVDDVVDSAIRKHRTPAWVKFGLGLVLVLGVAALGSVLFASRGRVSVQIELEGIDLADRSLSFTLDREPVTAERLAGPIPLAAGDHELEVRRGRTIVRRVRLTVTGGLRPTVEQADLTGRGR